MNATVPRPPAETRIRYRLINLVVPGVEPARAMRRFTSALIRLDLPTLDRPTRAMTGSSLVASPPPAATLVTNSPVRIFTNA